MCAASTIEAAAQCPTDPLVFASSGTSCAHAELLALCERLANVWNERARNEGALWSDLKRELAETSGVEAALQVYSERTGQRMRMALEDAQRIFEEHQRITARFSR